MTAHILGIDGGQTATRLLVVTRRGEILWSATAGSAYESPSRGRAADPPLQLARILRRALRHSPWRSASFEIAVLGLSGAEAGSPLKAAFGKAAARAIRAGRSVVVHDALTNLMGASAGEPGIVVIAGGGTVAYGATRDGRSWTCSGWGYVVGDEGGGFSVGRAAINAIFCARDGREPATSLTRAVLAEIGARSEVELKYAIARGKIAFGDIARLAPLVAGEARKGDRAARRILESAGSELARSAVTVARVLGLHRGAPDIYPTGGLFRETGILLPAFRDAVRLSLPRAVLRAPAFEPVVGTFFVALSRLRRRVTPAIGEALARSSENFGLRPPPS